MVDDNRLVALSFQEALANSGFLARSALSGKEALDMLHTDPADFVLTDIDMPGMNGYQLTRTLRNEFPEAKVYLMTGADRDDLVTMALAEGARRVFYKGRFGINDLIKEFE